MPDLDAIDRKILGHLQSDGRITMQELADKVGLSVSPCHRRAKLLEQRGVITRYIATVEAIRCGCSSWIASLALARTLRFSYAFGEGSACTESCKCLTRSRWAV